MPSSSSLSRLPDNPEDYSLVEFRLTPAGDQTILTLTQSNLVAEAAYEHARF